MQRQFFVGILMLAGCLGGAGGASGAEFFGDLVLGYSGGVGGLVQTGVSEFAPGFPLSVRLGIGYTSMDPGNAAAARKIFINDATNGTPTQGGRAWDFRFDLVYALKSDAFRQVRLFAGPRHSRFTGNFKFIGGNEDFDVTSSQWGFGGGIEGVFPMSDRLALMVTGGADYYADATLKGHDTSYSPDGEDVNPREGYSFADADEAINQPGFEPRVMVGLKLLFGN